jgi:DNA-binding transcriptional LysR family regulator
LARQSPQRRWRGYLILDDVTVLRTFVRIISAGSLSAAAREMGLALSVVSKRLATLERRTDLRLVTRNLLPPH